MIIFYSYFLHLFQLWFGGKCWQLIDNEPELDTALKGPLYIYINFFWLSLKCGFLREMLDHLSCLSLIEMKQFKNFRRRTSRNSYAYCTWKVTWGPNCTLLFCEYYKLEILCITDVIYTLNWLASLSLKSLSTRIHVHVQFACSCYCM